MSVFPDDIFAADPLAAVIEEKTIQLKEGERSLRSLMLIWMLGIILSFGMQIATVVVYISLRC
jgi:hypothetical protein